jgi:hypothetical protein
MTAPAAASPGQPSDAIKKAMEATLASIELPAAAPAAPAAESVILFAFKTFETVSYLLCAEFLLMILQTKRNLCIAAKKKPRKPSELFLRIRYIFC